jgi:TatA/E family protein of Tat protein translocase
VTLAFIESPLALIALFAIILICFGPQKVPEIANQIGRALGEFRRATSSFQQSMRVDDLDTSYKPTNYDSYGNPSDYSSSYSVPEEDLNTTNLAESHALPAAEVRHGDFAASALADDEFTYGTQPAPTNSVSGAVTSEAASVTPKPAEDAVPRNS